MVTRFNLTQVIQLRSMSVDISLFKLKGKDVLSVQLCPMLCTKFTKLTIELCRFYAGWRLVILLHWNKALWLVVASHTTSSSQWECFISADADYTRLKKLFIVSGLQLGPFRSKSWGVVYVIFLNNGPTPASFSFIFVFSNKHYNS